MTESERTELISYLAANPTAGVALGGGLYKLRVAREGGGKSGGFRSIHYYISGDSPVLLLTLFAKSEKSNHSAAELADLLKLSELLAAHYRRKS